MKCKKDDADLLNTCIRKKVSQLNSKKDSCKVSKRNQPLLRNSHLYNLKNCLEQVLKTLLKKLFLVLFHHKEDLVFLQMSNRVKSHYKKLYNSKLNKNLNVYNQLTIIQQDQLKMQEGITPIKVQQVSKEQLCSNNLLILRDNLKLQLELVLN